MTIDLRVVFRHLGLLVFALSALILGVGGFSFIEQLVDGATYGPDFKALVLTAAIGATVGALLFFAGHKRVELVGQREALLLVALSWILGAALAALPYYLWASFRPDYNEAAHNFDSFVDCYFESMSGLTTTGATIVEKLATLPRSLLLWRAITHWLGGLGIVVLFVAVFPMMGVGGRRVFRIESPGPTPDGMKPRIQDAARALWYIYLGLTVAEIIALMLCGMDWFNAICHTFATLATGGFSTNDSSVAGFDLTAVHIVIIAFMILAGVNFGLYYQILRGKWRHALGDKELHAYLGIMLVATVIVSISLFQSPSADVSPSGDMSASEAIRHSVFQVVAITTTTGFCSADFDTWGFAAKATLMLLMFVGGSAGSTGGGIKVIRVVTAAKILWAELEHAYRPKVVRSVKLGGATIDPELRTGILVYILGILILFAVGTILLMLFESGNHVDITTAATASASTINNIGPGLGRVGATQNYAWFTPSSKVIMSILMLVGRLEMFTVVVLFSPKFWTHD